MQPHRLAILVIATALSATMLSACAEAPFVATKPTDILAKPDDGMRRTGQFSVCFAGDDQAEAERVARQRCASHGFQTMFVTVTRYQCRVTAPHQATFRCYHPDLVDEKGGSYLNPFDAVAVEQWRKRTGKTPPAQPVPGWSAPMAAEPAPLGAPAPAALGPAQPGPVPPSAASPEAVPVPPVPEVSPPLPQPLPPDLSGGTGFSLPMGSWGEAFEQ